MEKMYNVKNRSAGTVSYKIPELNIKRFFHVGETKKISYDELEKLSYQPGGRKLMLHVLQIEEPEVVKQLDMSVEPEYWLDENKIKELIQGNDNLDAFLDCLDFAPVGVIELIKDLAVKLPMTDLNKIKALKQKTGFDVQLALINNQDDDDTPIEAPKRRVKAETEDKPARRTTTDYKIVNKAD